MAVSLGPGGLTLDNFTVPNNAPNTVLQVVYAAFTTAGQITGNTADVNISGFSASITPKRSDSKVLAIVSFSGQCFCDGRLKLKRGTTVVKDNILGTSRTSFDDCDTLTGMYLDSPATTSATTYQISSHTTGCGGNVYYNKSRSGTTGNGTSHIVLFEIAA